MWECGTSRAFLPHFHQVALHTKKRSWSKSNSKRQRISSYIFYFQRFQHRLIFAFLFIFSYLLPYMLLNIHIHIKFSSFFSKRKKKKKKTNFFPPPSFGQDWWTHAGNVNIHAYKMRPYSFHLIFPIYLIFCFPTGHRWPTGQQSAVCESEFSTVASTSRLPAVAIVFRSFGAWIQQRASHQMPTQFPAVSKWNKTKV